MNESTRSTTGGRGTARWLSAMTVVEIALAIMLVAGAGWLVRGFASLRSTNLGFVADKRLIFDVSFLGRAVPERRMRSARRRRRCIERLRAVPGVDRRRRHLELPADGTPLEGSLIAQLHGEPLDPVASDRHAAALRQRRAISRRPARGSSRGATSAPTIGANTTPRRDRQPRRS